MSEEIEALKLALNELPDEEARSLAIIDYLEIRRAAGMLEDLPEGSVTALLNLLPPYTRAAVTANAMCLPMALAAQQVAGLRQTNQQGESQ